MSSQLYAGLRVRDFQAALAWYQPLFGEPTFFPHATEAVWMQADNHGVYIEEHADGTGFCELTLLVEDLEAHVAAVSARGLEPTERLTYSNGVKKAVYRDPDGNEIGFGGLPPEA
jgi:catechol 2,3-dioxygenase-like lactoylglutathione lyase family enzyme